jgi:hypothetical protein
MAYHDEVCVNEDTINAEYPSTVCLGNAEGDGLVLGQPVVDGRHYVLDLVSGAIIDTDAQEVTDAG